ncbi:hypothetical protein D3C85_1810340 [compost metagenome]
MGAAVEVFQRKHRAAPGLAYGVAIQQQPIDVVGAQARLAHGADDQVAFAIADGGIGFGYQNA